MIKEDKDRTDPKAGFDHGISEGHGREASRDAQEEDKACARA